MAETVAEMEAEIEQSGFALFKPFSLNHYRPLSLDLLQIADIISFSPLSLNLDHDPKLTL